ncbi:MAG: S41 family peptidase [Bacteroidota bacterium]
MKITLKYKFLVCLLIIFSAFKCSDDDAPTFTNDWDEDVYYFAKNLKDNHKNLFYKVSEDEFDRDIDVLRQQTDVLPAEEIVISLQKITGKIGDSHTGVASGSYYDLMPIRFEWTSDGLVITDIISSQQMFLGKTVDRINGNLIATVSDSLKTLIAYENESWLKYQIVNYYRVPQILKYFGFSNTDNEVIFNLSSGEEFTLTTVSNPTVSLYDNLSPPLYLSNTEDFYWSEYLSDKKIYYIQYNKASAMPDYSFQTFNNDIKEELSNNNEIEKIVIDLRLNTGGNSAIAQPLIQQMTNLVNTNQFDKSKIFVIIGRRTFSSGFLNAWDLKEAIDPVFVGEPTGGKPNHFGEVGDFRLPNSFLRVFYSKKYFEISANDENTLEPDILIELSADDLVNGHDPVLEYIEQH